MLTLSLFNSERGILSSKLVSFVARVDCWVQSSFALWKKKKNPLQIKNICMHQEKIKPRSESDTSVQLRIGVDVGFPREKLEDGLT